MLQTTHIKLEPKDYIFLINYLGIQFTHELFQQFRYKQGKAEQRAQ